MAKQKVQVIFFKTDSRLTGDEVVSETGEIYLEKRPLGKWLCYKKGNLLKTIKLSKKSYKNLVRFTCGTRMEKYIDEEDSVDYCGRDEYKELAGYRNYGKEKRAYRREERESKWDLKKEIAPFIMEEFSYAQ